MANITTTLTGFPDAVDTYTAQTALVSIVNAAHYNGFASAVTAVQAAIGTRKTLGSILFATTSGVFTQDNSNLYWDQDGAKLRIGGTPDSTFSAIKVTIQSQKASGDDLALIYAGSEAATMGLKQVHARGTLASPSANSTDDLLLSVSGRGYGTSAYAANSNVSVRGYAAQTFTNTAQGSYLSFLTTATGNSTESERMRIDDAGRVLIGHTVAVGGISALNFLVQIACDSNSFPLQMAKYQAGGSGGVMGHAKSRNATIGSHTIVQNDDNLGQFVWAGSDGAKFIRASSILTKCDGTATTNSVPGAIAFNVMAENETSASERCRLTAQGALLFGVTTANSCRPSDIAFANSKAIRFNNAAASDTATALSYNASNNIRMDFATQSTIGGNGGASALTALPVGYIIIDLSGTERIIPFYNKA